MENNSGRHYIGQAFEIYDVELDAERASFCLVIEESVDDTALIRVRLLSGTERTLPVWFFRQMPTVIQAVLSSETTVPTNKMYAVR